MNPKGQHTCQGLSPQWIKFSPQQGKPKEEDLFKMQAMS